MPTLTIGVHRSLVAEYDDDKGQRPQCANVEPHPIGAESQDGRAKDQLADSHDDAGYCQIADPPPIRHGRRPDIVGRQRHAEKVARDHDEDHQQGRQNRMPGHDQADRQEKHLHCLLGNRIQRIAQDALERHATFLDGSDDAGEARLGQHHAGRRFGDVGCRRDRDSDLRLAQRRGIVGAVAAHPNGMTTLLKRLDELVLILRQDAGEDRELLRMDSVGASFPVRAVALVKWFLRWRFRLRA
jgi:hypothetical protein